MKIYKKLILATILSLVVYFAYFHVNVALSYQISPTKTSVSEMNVRIIHEKKPRSIKDEIKFVFKDNWKVAYAVMMSEGELNVKAFHQNNDRLRTHDRGLFQLNSFWHIEVLDSCAYNMECNIKEAYRISKGGTDWHEWYGYTKGDYLKYL